MVLGAALTLLARWRHWMLPLGTDWRPLRGAPDRVLGALRDRTRARAQARSRPRRGDDSGVS